jgi:hypothetical protein
VPIFTEKDMVKLNNKPKPEVFKQEQYG